MSFCVLFRIVFVMPLDCFFLFSSGDQFFYQCFQSKIWFLFLLMPRRFVVKVWKENEWHTTFQIQEKEKNYNYLQKIVFKGQLGGRGTRINWLCLMLTIFLMKKVLMPVIEATEGIFCHFLFAKVHGIWGQLHDTKQFSTQGGKWREGFFFQNLVLLL